MVTDVVKENDRTMKRDKNWDLEQGSYEHVIKSVILHKSKNSSELLWVKNLCAWKIINWRYLDKSEKFENENMKRIGMIIGVCDICVK